jgi:hypothetical protein
LPLAGLVMVSDGADTADTALGEALLGLKAEAVPVFTVGVGRETLERDIQIGRVTTPRTALKGTTLLVDVVIAQKGFDGHVGHARRRRRGPHRVARQQVTLPAAGAPATVPVRITVDEAGPRVLRFRVPARPGELVADNNQREALIDVRDRREKILYFEGEPRFELKFIRSAVTDDENVEVVALQRTADNKYLRLGVESADELVTGFPKTREELFAYRGLVLGSVEAGAFTGDQLRMIAEFADRRGGGLLALGGHRAFSEGGYAGTAVAEALPVVLDANLRQKDGEVQRLPVRPTRAGAASAVAQIAATEAASTERWTTLPEVTVVNRLGPIKPGATVLLAAADAARVSTRCSPSSVTAAARRSRSRRRTRGSGRCTPHGGRRSDARELLAAAAALGGGRSARPGGDSHHVRPRRARQHRELHDHGRRQGVRRAERCLGDGHHHRSRRRGDGRALTWGGEKAGEYAGTFTAAAPGWYEMRVPPRAAGRRWAPRSPTCAPRRASRSTSTPPCGPGRCAASPRRPAAATTGRRTGTLADDLRYTGRGVTTVEEHDLWHMPIVLLLLVGLLSAEWGYRRAVGLP